MMKQFTDDFFSLWRSLKPTIAKVHGHAVAGGSDIALSCDLVVMAEDARIGYMPARVWGCPTTAMWVYRLGAERAKRMLLTGDTIDGRTAAEWGWFWTRHRPRSWTREWSSWRTGSRPCRSTSSPCRS
ncbi:enoyl-CoA hydratase-related protein [Nonomuraea polychroma]|uniref:enoyl-CoA hydratase-related protein n=1 Tax=Nonomuraea polychroma TaxID=46176 RepID=UPI003D943302